MRERGGTRSRPRVPEGTVGRRRGAQVAFRSKHGAGFIDLISAGWLPSSSSRCSQSLLGVAVACVRGAGVLVRSNVVEKVRGFPVVAQPLRELAVSCLTHASMLLSARAGPEVQTNASYWNSVTEPRRTFCSG